MAKMLCRAELHRDYRTRQPTPLSLFHPSVASTCQVTFAKIDGIKSTCQRYLSSIQLSLLTGLAEALRIHMRTIHLHRGYGAKQSPSFNKTPRYSYMLSQSSISPELAAFHWPCPCFLMLHGDKTKISTHSYLTASAHTPQHYLLCEGSAVPLALEAKLYD